MLNPYNTNLPPDLRSLKEEIEGYARGYGLDFFETIFEVIDADDLNEIAAYGGFPTRYPHWSFGMSYEELRKGYDYGLSKIYEMVINNDPCYAYLMRSNHVVDQKLVMSHVFGHCDFFKNNAYFAHTSRKMMDEMANHGARIRRYVEKYGEDEVEKFMDRCMSIDDLIDVHSVAIRRREPASRYDFTPKPEEGDEVHGTRFKSKDYMDDYINPRAVLKAEEDERRKQQEQAARNFPERPEKDVLLFLIEHAPLKGWQRDMLEIIRDEAYYFAPQGMTKVLNEGWACLLSGSLIYTNRGLLPIDEVVERRLPVKVHDGEGYRRVYDWAKFEDRETIRVKTRRGLELEGSATHQLLLPDGSWRRLADLHAGDQVTIGGRSNLWPKKYVRVAWKSKAFSGLLGVGVGMVAAVGGVATIDESTTKYVKPYIFGFRRPIRVPPVVDEECGAFLGYIIGDGHISIVKRTIGLTTGDDEQADHFISLVERLFTLQPRKKRDGGKWRISFSSANLADFLIHLGLKTGVCARQKTVPDAILRSPKSVVGAFLRSLYDCDGYAGKAGVILSTSSTEMSKTVQLLLLNFGILSRRRPHKDGCWHIHTMGRAAAVFLKEIGFGLERKQNALRAYVGGHKWFKEQPWDDEIVSIERRRADVYDISVEGTHRYAAQGFINHNSYWHSTIMTQKALDPSEVIDFADHHSGTMAMQRTRINPYKLGIELLRDIEERWNTGRFGKEYDECEDLDRRRSWDLKLGLGRQKIFEVRRIHNDITFIDTFLTPEFCVRHGFFTYAYQEQAGQYIIESREFEKVKQRLLFSLTNFGKPWIYVVDGNFRNRGELLLRHQHNGVDLRLDQASDVLTNLQAIWSRPVHLQTLVEGKPTMLSFDGTDHTIKTGGETDDPRRNAPAKTR
ncbi:MAG TPA: SpoVR family protein [Planctomycetales bacterium]|jgi:stage V sporulation protein R|nr:SpoVR family protein [Planctomycetales bacterium]